MKKALSLILALVMCLSLCACGGNNTADDNKSPETNAPKVTEPKATEPEATEPAENMATVITNEGKTVKISSKDLFDESDANEARFSKLYGGASIEFIGTVKYIKTDTYVYTGEAVITNQHKIVFEEGWCLIIGNENNAYDLADYYPGQLLKVSTGIVGAEFDTEFLQEIADNNRVVWLAGNESMKGEVITNHSTTITVVEE